MDFWTLQLPRQSPYGRTVLGLAETVSKLKAEDCRRFHQRYLVPNNLVLAIYGDIDPQATTLLLQERSRSGGTGAVHLEAAHESILQPQVLRILTTDLEHGVRFGHEVGCGSGLGRDLVGDPPGLGQLAL